jgi:hypothetical protein
MALIRVDVWLMKRRELSLAALAQVPGPSMHDLGAPPYLSHSCR